MTRRLSNAKSCAGSVTRFSLPKSLKILLDLVTNSGHALGRSKSPTQLGDIHGFSDIPIPTLFKKRDPSVEAGKARQDDDEENEEGEK